MNVPGWMQWDRNIVLGKTWHGKQEFGSYFCKMELYGYAYVYVYVRMHVIRTCT